MTAEQIMAGPNVIDLVLDISVFRRDRVRQSPAFRALKKLLEENRVILHLPEWVKRGVISQLQEDAEERISALLIAARGSRDTSYIPEPGQFSKEIGEKIAYLRQFIPTQTAESFKK